MTMYFAEDRQKITVVCERCGYETTTSSRNLYRQTNLDLCKSCKAQPSNTVVKNGVACTPHRGEVDLDTMAPLDDNLEPYLPGYRICGMADCIAPSHVRTIPPKEEPKPLAYKPGRAILNGKVMTYKQFLELEKIRIPSK